MSPISISPTNPLPSRCIPGTHEPFLPTPVALPQPASSAAPAGLQHARKSNTSGRMGKGRVPVRGGLHPGPRPSTSGESKAGRYCAVFVLRSCCSSFVVKQADLLVCARVCVRFPVYDIGCWCRLALASSSQVCLQELGSTLGRTQTSSR